MNELTAKLEALLFIHGEPLPLKKAAKFMDTDKDGLQSALAALEERFRGDGEGLCVIFDAPLGEIFASADWGAHSVQLATKPEFGGIMEEFVKEELQEDLTPAALEALSLILYLGHLPRSRMDFLRGVNSSFIVRSLLLRGLVERYPDPERPHIYLYRATLDALKHLGISSPADLPEYSKFRELASVDGEKKEKETELETGSGDAEG